MNEAAPFTRPNIFEHMQTAPKYVLPVERICKNCKWWDKAEDEEVRGFCLNRKLYAENSEFKSENDCLVGLSASGIVTGPRFGCVHFEVAPQDEPK